MTLALREISPRTFVERVLVSNKALSAMVVDDEAIDAATEELITSLKDAEVPHAVAGLDRRLGERRAALFRGKPAKTVVVASTSQDEALWRGVDMHRSRLEDGATTLLVLSHDAADSLQRNAPNLASLLTGNFWALAEDIGPALRAATESAARAKYLELYEAVTRREAADLEDATDNVIAALGDPLKDERAWRRLAFMGRAMLVEVLPTISGHLPAAVSDANAVLEALDAWLASPSEPSAIRVPADGPRASQAIVEAMVVVQNAARLTQRGRARESAAAIVDACLQGYAIFPGSAGRRSLFDWWLHQVIPAAWALGRPPRFARRNP